MLSKKLKLTLAALCLSSFAAASQAKAELHRADAYESLTAVPLAPGQAPRYVNGVADLSQDENRHPERLPLQLDGALKKVKKSKYSPSGLSRDTTVDF